MTDDGTAAKGGSARSGRLTTHVLDTMAGRPAAGVLVQLERLDAGARTLIREAATNADGRLDHPLLEKDQMQRGCYELTFYAGDYFRANGVALPDPAFLDTVPVRFGIADPGAHYHVPLLIAPFGFSTYRGS